MTTSSLHRCGVVLGIVVLVVGVFVIGAVPVVASEMPQSHAGHMPMGGGHMQGVSSPFIWLVPFVMPVLWLGLLGGVVYLFYRFISSASSTNSAMEALDRGFARGEISVDEYEQRRERLKS